MLILPILCSMDDCSRGRSVRVCPCGHTDFPVPVPGVFEERFDDETEFQEKSSDKEDVEEIGKSGQRKR
jgi:hypothetical protein